jgi:hypothetical protein
MDPQASAPSLEREEHGHSRYCIRGIYTILLCQGKMTWDLTVLFLLLLPSSIDDIDDIMLTGNDYTLAGHSRTSVCSFIWEWAVNPNKIQDLGPSEKFVEWPGSQDKTYLTLGIVLDKVPTFLTPIW